MKNNVLVPAFLGFLILPLFGYSQIPLGIKKQNTSVTSFSYSLGNYDIGQVNKTRRDSSAAPLKKSSYLDSCALVRCKRMAEIIGKNKDVFFTDNLNIFYKEGHKERTTAENASLSPFKGAGVTEDKIPLLKESDVDSLLKSGNKFLAGPLYNKSESHLENRITPGYSEYGSCYLVVFIKARNYDPEATMKYIPIRVIIHYELFR